ncbi:5715_t:CDS:2 [Entrophospora sp. SA101]|nr:5715_t:CDS:2 [Entrophospora sp. SA101]
MYTVAEVAEKVATRALKSAVSENVKTVTEINFAWLWLHINDTF